MLFHRGATTFVDTIDRAGRGEIRYILLLFLVRFFERRALKVVHEDAGIVTTGHCAHRCESRDIRDVIVVIGEG